MPHFNTAFPFFSEASASTPESAPVTQADFIQLKDALAPVIEWAAMMVAERKAAENSVKASAPADQSAEVLPEETAPVSDTAGVTETKASAQDAPVPENTGDASVPAPTVPETSSEATATVTEPAPESLFEASTPAADDSELSPHLDATVASF